MTPSVIDPCERRDLFAELANLPPKPPRSKLEPHRELIRELRRKGRTYREVALLFEERLGFPCRMSRDSALETAGRVPRCNKAEAMIGLPSGRREISRRMASARGDTSVVDGEGSYGS